MDARHAIELFHLQFARLLCSGPDAADFAIKGGCNLPLKARGIRITDVTAPKQTETTQRWKLALALEGHALPRNTKVEFSRRTSVAGVRVEPIASAFAAAHGLQSLLLPHYPLNIAIQQKVSALVGRAQVQARDLFDLSALFARARGDLSALAPVRSELPAALSRAQELTFDEFASQVVAYLAPPFDAEYGSPAAWNALQAQVVECLAKAQELP